MLTPEQIELRRQGIGSSDIPRIVGVSPHGTAIDVYLDKLGLVEHEDSDEKDLGNELEDAIAQRYARRTGAELYDTRETSAHRGHPWALATPDRVAYVGPARGVEIKLVGASMLHLWRDGLATHVEIQVRWQMEVLDVERWDVAALLGGTDFRIYPVERDRDLGADLLALGEDFWINHVLARDPPPMSGEDARRLAQLRYPISMGDMLEPTPKAEALRDRILRVKRHQKRVEDLRAHLEALAIAMIGSSDGIKGCFTRSHVGKAETWKAAARETFMAGAAASAEEMWRRLEQWAGDDEAVWQALALRGGADRALVKTEGAPRRRFLTKEPRNGGRR